jgi:hypothetical protein
VKSAVGIMPTDGYYTACIILVGIIRDVTHRSPLVRRAYQNHGYQAQNVPHGRVVVGFEMNKLVKKCFPAIFVLFGSLRSCI